MRRRVLSIQGGGVNGIFAAKLLALFEEDLEKEGLSPRAGRYFDLVAGTSTGGLVALGLGLEIPASEIVELYREKSSLIFPAWQRKFLWKLACRFRRSPRPFYDAGALIDELKNVFGNRKLGESVTRVVIPTFNQSTDRIHLFKTAHHEAFKHDYKLPAWDIAAATAAAPFYFPPHKMENGASFLDGGVWANNPIFVAIAECIQYCGWDRREVDILSVSGIRSTMEIAKWQKLTGLPGALLNSQVKGSLASSKTLLGDVNGVGEPHGRVIDVAIDAADGAFVMDDASSVDDLLGMADDVFRRRADELKSVFFGDPTEKFGPVRF